MENRTYLAIDLKSFYASVECVERGLDPMKTHLVVADESRMEKTICLAVTPSLKAYGVPGRPRLFEVAQRVRAINEDRRRRAPGQVLSGSSWNDTELKASPGLALDYLVVQPRMALYMTYGTRIYERYLKYIAPEDIHVYSIDEVLWILRLIWISIGFPRMRLRSKLFSTYKKLGPYCRRRDWAEPVPLQSSHGYWREAYPAGRERGSDCNAG